MRGHCAMVGHASAGQRRGSTMIEFCLSVALWTAVLMGLSTVGLNLIRALQVEQICRDAGRMYSAGLDFTQAGNQNLLIMLATGLNVTANGGNGAFVFSTVEYIDTPQCASCANLHQYVFIQRIVVGNAGLFSSPFGTPAAGIIGTSGNIASSDYLTNASARVQDFVAAYRRRYGGDTPDSNASLGYDSVLVLADAIRRAGSTEHRALRDAIASTRDFDAVTGRITINEKRDASKNAVIIQVRNGRFQFVESVSP